MTGSANSMIDRPGVRLSEAFDQSAVAKAWIGLRGPSFARLIEVNAAAHHALGAAPASLAGSPVSALLAAEDVQVVTTLLRQMVRGRRTRVSGDWQLVARDGSRLWMSGHAVTVHDADGPLAVLVEAFDISRRKAYEQALVESEARFRSLFESAPIGMALVGLDGAWLRVNPALSRITGYEPEELRSRDFQSISHPEDLEADLAQVRLLVTGEITHYQMHKRYLRKDGTIIRCLLSVTLLRDESGSPLHFLSQIVDVTEARAAQAAQQRSEQQFRAAFDASPLGMVIADQEGVLVRVNPAFAGMLDRDPASLLGRSYREFVHPDDRAASDWRPGASEGRPGEVSVREKRLVRPDGTEVWVRVGLTRITAPDGSYQHLAQVEDVTARRNAEQDAQRERTRLRTTIAVQREVTAAADDRDTVLRLVAERVLAVLPAADGATVEILEGDQLRYVAATGTLAAHEGMVIPVAGSLGGLALTRRETMHCADAARDPRVNAQVCRQVGIASMLITPLFAGDTPMGVLKVSSQRAEAFDEADQQQLIALGEAVGGALRHADISARNACLLKRSNQALTQLKASENRFRRSFDNSPLGMAVTAVTGAHPGTLLQVNAKLAEITGRTVDELTGSDLHDIHHPDDLAEARTAVAELGRGDIDTYTGTRRYLRPDSSIVWVRVHAALVRDDDGAPAYIVSQVEDVSARRLIEQKLRERAQLLDLTPDAVIVRDLDGVVTYWSPGAEHVYGWRADSTVGHRAAQLLATRDPGDAPGPSRAWLLEHSTWEGELEHRRADGRRVVVLSRQALQRDNDGRAVAILSIDSDITARRSAERALAVSEQRFRAQFTDSAIGQIIRGLDDRIENANPAFADMLGYPIDQLIGDTVTRHLDPDILPERDRLLAQIYAGRRDWFSQDTRIRHRDGGWIDVHTTVSVLRDPAGYPERFVCAYQDVTARKSAEAARDRAIADLAEHNHDLKAANQLKLDLLGMLGHEISSPLATILGCTELITEDAGDAETGPTLARIQRAAHRLDGIMREVLAMVSLDAGKLTAAPQPVEVVAHLRAALDHAGIDIPVTSPAGLLAAVQPGHLDQILTNLLSNAAKYGGGATLMTARRCEGHTEIRISDSGPGVPAEFRDRLFERFTRDHGTATTVNGTGLGLYIVRELARANGGDVRYEPVEPTGAMFVVQLPMP